MRGEHADHEFEGEFGPTEAGVPPKLVKELIVLANSGGDTVEMRSGT